MLSSKLLAMGCYSPKICLCILHNSTSLNFSLQVLLYENSLFDDLNILYTINRLNNRKARLARASKDVRPAPEIDNTFPSKQTARGRQSLSESPSSPGDDNLSLNPTNTKGINTRSSSRMGPHEMSEVMTQYGNNSAPEFVQCKPGQYFVLVDGQGEEIARGKVHQVQGKWYGRSLEESETCIVDILELKADRRLGLPYPSEDTGTNFEEAEMKIGVMRVMWDLNKIYVLQSQ